MITKNNGCHEAFCILVSQSLTICVCVFLFLYAHAVELTRHIKHIFLSFILMEKSRRNELKIASIDITIYIFKSNWLLFTRISVTKYIYFFVLIFTCKTVCYTVSYVNYTRIINTFVSCIMRVLFNIFFCFVCAETFKTQLVLFQVGMFFWILIVFNANVVFIFVLLSVVQVISSMDM